MKLLCFMHSTNQWKKWQIIGSKRPGQVTTYCAEDRFTQFKANQSFASIRVIFFQSTDENTAKERLSYDAMRS